MEKLVLADGTELEIQSGATQRNIVMHTPDIASLAEVVKALTKENLKAVKFTCDGTTVGEYVDMVLEEPHLQITMADGFLIVGFGIREMTLEELQQKDVAIVLTFLTDEQAVTVKGLHPEWKELIGKTVKIGTRFVYEDVLYKTIQDNLLIQNQYVPGQGTESIYIRIDESHSGTLADPIPYHVNMEVFQGKYYTEDGILYKCTRDSGQALHNKASELVGHYFEVVEEGK